MKNYNISWENEQIKSDNPLSAAKKAISWIMENPNEQQLYVKDNDTNDIFSVDLAEISDVAVLPVDHYKSVINQYETKTIYFIFGKEACEILFDDDMDQLIDDIESFGVEYTLFKYIEGITTPIDLLIAFKGNEDYCIISEDEYNKLDNI